MPETRTRLPTLTGLRFVAAAAVMSEHFLQTTNGAVHRYLHRFTDQGGLGVEFFFLLSGFVLVWSAKPGDSATGFWRRRVARIYPAYLVALAGGVIVTHSVEHQHIGLGRLLLCVLLLQAWVPDAEDYFFAFNAPLWSLSCEAFFYALFPAAKQLLRVPSRRQILIAIVVALVVVDLAGYAALGPDARGDRVSTWAIYIFPLKRLAEFVIGMLLAGEVRDGRAPSLPFGRSLAVTVVLYFAAGFGPSGQGYEAVMLLPMCALLIAGAQRDLDERGGVLTGRVGQKLGEASYSLYLTHQLVARVAVQHHHGVFHGSAAAGALVGMTVVALALAFALHLLVERPLEKRLRGAPGVSVSDGG